jgi:predicted DNA-binding transcriptional regulator AlpA
MSNSAVTPKLGYSIRETMETTSLGRTKIYSLLSDPDCPLTAIKVGGRTIVTGESIKKLMSGED